jgi:hypothetical protein
MMKMKDITTGRDIDRVLRDDSGQLVRVLPYPGHEFLGIKSEATI